LLLAARFTSPAGAVLRRKLPGTLAKRFDETEIAWAMVEKQLVAWGQYFQKGKKLRVNVSFNYVEAGPQLASSYTKGGDKRGSTSATQRMLAEPELQLIADSPGK
jgi:hypothetical protein